MDRAYVKRTRNEIVFASLDGYLDKMYEKCCELFNYLESEKSKSGADVSAVQKEIDECKADITDIVATYTPAEDMSEFIDKFRQSGFINEDKNTNIDNDDIYDKAFALCGAVTSGRLPDDQSVYNNLNNAVRTVESLLSSGSEEKAKDLTDKIIESAGNYYTQREYLKHEITDKQDMLQSSYKSKLDDIWKQYRNSKSPAGVNKADDNTESMQNTISDFENRLMKANEMYSSYSPEVVNLNNEVIDWCKKNLIGVDANSDLIKFANMQFYFSKLLESATVGDKDTVNGSKSEQVRFGEQTFKGAGELRDWIFTLINMQLSFGLKDDSIRYARTLLKEAECFDFYESLKSDLVELFKSNGVDFNPI